MSEVVGRGKLQTAPQLVFSPRLCRRYLMVGLIDSECGYTFEGGVVKLHVLTPNYQLLTL